jgi:hypothetical protein
VGEEDEASAGGTVLGPDADSPDGGPTRGSGGRGRSSGEPGRMAVVAGGGGVARVPR